LFVCLPAQAEVLFDDPTDDTLNEVIGGASCDTIDSWATDDSARSQYLTGIVTLNGERRCGIERDNERSAAFLKKAWEKGAADAALTLGLMYYGGYGVEKNNEKAVELLVASAKGGHVRAQRELGWAYWGRGGGLSDVFDKDLEKALFWLKKAGRAGDKKAAYSVSSIYLMDDDVKRDEAQIFYWVKVASEAKYGHETIGFGRLAECYEKGIGTDRNLVIAYKYYDLTGTAGVEGKQRVSKGMTEEQINKAIRLSLQWQAEHHIYFPSYRGLQHQPDGSYR
ncbi:tetratricopeptide repeat protein, partial [Arhodomonas aquaeolei]|uniref:tetratricopeptide repeat protein n=1 Tax=Arhodomonas aquaeolei TaxID=2369 RepID=UPI000A052F80